MKPGIRILSLYDCQLCLTAYFRPEMRVLLPMIITLLTGLALAAPAPPRDLSVNEGRINPIGFHDATPSFSWKLDDPRQGAKQSAYQILVTHTGSEHPETLWDSGKVVSDQSVYVPYSGPALTSRQRIAWRVRYWDQESAESDWSTWSHLELGLLENSDWKGSWIHLPKDDFKAPEELGSPVVHLRKSFSIEQVPEMARLYLTAKGIVDFRINGQLVTPDAFVPGWTDYTQKIETLTYDVGPLLRKGENVLAARISDGWYAGTISKRFYGSMPELLAQLELKSPEGKVLELIATDQSWSYSIDGPITMADIWHGEDYDARKELTGWDLPDYPSADRFKPVSTTPIDPKVRLSPKRFQSTRVIESIKPVTLRKFGEGKVIFDLGQNMVGWIHLQLPARKGQTVTIRMAEMLNDDGTLYRGNYRTARSLANYIPAKDGIADYTQTFTFFGFRYVEISGFDQTAEPSLDWVSGEVLHTDFARTGSFDSSHEKLNKLQSNIVWSQRGNFLDIPTDCPQRNERYGWTGDAQVFTPVSLFNYDTHAFLMSYLESIKQEMKPDGGVPNIIPSNQYRGWVNSAGWGDAAFVIPWELYLRTGDIEVLREFYPMMKKRVGYYTNKAKDGIVDEPKSFGDWLQPKSYGTKPVGTDDRSGETSTRLLTTCYYAYGAKLCAQAAEALGKSDEAAKYKALVDEIKTAASNKFFDNDGRVIEGTATQSAYVLPLAFGLIDGELADKATGHLSEKIEEFGNLLNTGFIGTSVLIPTLEKHGLREQALNILFTSDYPSWFYSIVQGATSIWERWNSYTKKDGFGDDSMNSFNHYAYGAVGGFFYEKLAGLAPSANAPGYSEILVAPILDDRVPLDHAEASLITRYGVASNKWEKSNSAWQMETIIPPNTTGRLTLPFKPEEIHVLKGSADFKASGDGSTASVPAGSYHFKITR
ncbi:family 78 glycoside hydrolase catalytic domain [Haloferula chungangensis]|uniref:alpha-L-rhamnosidase n=1 Tax=Haloferula chungangensis TaxID=1048331 RepID=A0ABW2KZY9_9BACT